MKMMKQFELLTDDGETGYYTCPMDDIKIIFDGKSGGLQIIVKGKKDERQ